MTYFTSLNYTNYTLVTDWYVEGNEIADHTMTHPELPGLVATSDPESGADSIQAEINGNLIALNALAGIPLSSITGFRAPFLNYSVEVLKAVKAAGFTYDSSATSSIPVTDNGTDAYWPYTLDYGLANDCLSFPNICNGQPQIPGLWEIPMYAIFDEKGAVGTHLMDPWLDGNASAVLNWMKNTFTAHYNGNRQPFGLYTHPIHVATGYPGIPDPTATIAMINNFLDWAQQQPNVWIVSNQQLLDWVRNPVPVSQLGNQASLKCSTPQIDAGTKICNGIPSMEAGLIQQCFFSDSPFYTCYGCPMQPPTPANPNPPQVSPTGSNAVFRARLPANCSTPFWDPIGAKCLCTNAQCNFIDQSRPIGPNGANLTGGGTGGSNAPSASSTYVPFSGAPPALIKDARAVWFGVMVALLGMMGGWIAVVGAA
jgi:peptidoglycan/xylan/chitin deacetylase (PgdA/CDA1 family)